jgi:hypothetical protein
VDPNKLGMSCVLMITGIVEGGPKLQHNPGAGNPYNSVQNGQCDALGNVWGADRCTVFARYHSRGYRIRPGDPRGILEVSPSGMAVADDWEPLATGVIDLQAAIRVWDDDGVDQDGDGDPARDWYSGDNMESIVTASGVRILGASVSLVARTTAEISGPGTAALPAFSVEGNLAHNRLGDREAVTLAPPVTTDPELPTYGNHAYRWTTATIDLRNVGVGL